MKHYEFVASRKVYLLWLHGIIIPSEMPFWALIKPSVQSLMEVCFYNEQQALSYYSEVVTTSSKTC